MIYAEQSTLPGACGVGAAFDFTESSRYCKPITEMNKGGAGWLCAGFVEGDYISNDAFKLLNDKYTLVYKTPVRKNVNSGNMFYFAVFDTSESGVPTGYEECDD